MTEQVGIGPVTYCRIFRVGPPCPHPCADCKRSDALLTDEDRVRLLADPDAQHGHCARGLPPVECTTNCLPGCPSIVPDYSSLPGVSL